MNTLIIDKNYEGIVDEGYRYSFEGSIEFDGSIEFKLNK